MRRTAFALSTLALATTAALAQTPPPAQQVEVVGTSPLPGLGVDRNQLPYASQVIRRNALDRAQSDNVSDYLARRVPGVQVNDIQGSPFQGDLTYRGYRASGLLGAAQGLSVFVDGVRINEPFGDVVNWDLIPEFALDGLTITPAANPAFGLNTLGGALSFATANGRSAPGLNVEASLGSFARKRVSATLGQSHADGWHSFVGASAFHENGWRDHSPGRILQGLAKIGRAVGATDWEATVLAGRSTLVGNGLVPAYTVDDDSGERTPDLYASRREAVFTHPDRTRNRLGQLALSASHRLDDASRLQGLIYVRSTQRDTVNGDLAEEAEDDEEDVEGLRRARAASARVRPLAVGVGPANASLNTTATRQTAWGLAASLARRSGAHQWQVGATLDASRVRYQQLEQEAWLDSTRLAEAGTQAPELSARVTGSSVSLGLYATDTWRLAPGTHATATLRLNRARVSNQLTTRDDDDPTLLDEQAKETFTYNSVNPALGIAHDLAAGLTVFGNLARNTRVPTVIELGCANPDEPCRLPAGLQSDPYLKQVRATSLELGLRWRPVPTQRLELTLYRNDNRDDILFGSVSTTGQLGYFQNFERTRHQGLDLMWQGRYGAVELSAAYGHLRATYEANATLRMGERNVVVTPGTRMAGLPEHQAKFAADWRLSPAWRVGADVQWLGRRGVLGNEDGLLEDGATERHDVSLPAYTLLNLRAAWTLKPGLEVTLRVSNVANRRYESFGALAETVFDATGQFTGAETPAVFVAPGAPRSVHVGVKMTF